MGGVAPGVATKFERRTAVAWTGALMVIDPKGTAVGLVDANDKEGVALAGTTWVLPIEAVAAAALFEDEACRTSILAVASPEALRATTAASRLEKRIV